MTRLLNMMAMGALVCTSAAALAQVPAAAPAAPIDLAKLQNHTGRRPVMIDKTLVMIPSGKRDIAKEEANKRLVLAWHDDFWNKGNFQNWPKYMKPDFINHDPAEPPVGAQALVDWLEKSLKDHNRQKPPPKPVQTKLFVLADGDLVFIVGGKPNTDPAVDPARTFAGNMIRVENGKIAEWWFTGEIVKGPGNPVAPPATPTPTPGS